MFWMDTRWMYVGFICIYRVNRCQQFMFCRCQVPPFTQWGRQIKWTQIMTRIWAKSQGPRRSDPLLWMVIAHWNALITSWFTHHLTCLLAVSWNNGPMKPSLASPWKWPIWTGTSRQRLHLWWQRLGVAGGVVVKASILSHDSHGLTCFSGRLKQPVRIWWGPLRGQQLTQSC